MSNLKRARSMLRVAQRDLRALKGMLNRDTFADEVFGFFVQQAAEKGLKAWLSVLGDVYPFTHNLGLLLQRLENYGKDVSPYWDLLEFNPFAVQLRYDDFNERDVEIDREREIERLEALLEIIEGEIDQDK